ncbi:MULTISPECIES: hypothetical protein [Salinibaculum]|uniref:hypothetical protein n=1 Tax=Salinibaculum TaxID=2732368 RepID=UPI0030D2B306
MPASTVSRRRLLATLAGGVAGAVAGCSESQGTTGNADGNDGGTGTATRTPSATAAATATETSTRLDADVEIVASYPVETGNGTEHRETTVLDERDVAAVGRVQEGAGGRPPSVPVGLTESGAENFTTAMREFGFTSSAGIQACRYEERPDDPGYCLQTVLDGEVVFSASMSSGLARTLESGAFADDPRFVLQTRNLSKARDLRASLEGNSSSE